ncbi:MAG: TRAP transporter large permease [Lautropia sp.]
MTWLIAVVPLLLLVLGFPIYVVLLASTSVIALITMDIPLTLVPQVMFGSLDKFTLLAVPFFIFAGEIMSEGGISRRIVQWLLSMVGRLRGGLAFATIGASEFFGAVSGSSPATVAAIGKLMYPALRRGGYSDHFSLGLITSSGAIASVMPPSIVMILYGAASEQSVAALFAGGVVPALLIGAITVGYIAWTARGKTTADADTLALPRPWQATRDAIWALGTPVLILGGIYLGIFSPTEAAGVAGIYGIFVTMAIYREVDLAGLWRITLNSALLTSQILIIVAASGVFSWLLTVSGIPQTLVQILGGSTQTTWMMLLLANVFLLIVGCFVDPVSAIIILTPLLVPLMQSLGVDLVHFGIVLTVNLSIGMFTPPFGLNIFVSQALFKAPLPTIYRGLVPFIVLQLVALVIVTYVPSVSLALADLVRKQ